ncbi:hypothetical protein BDP67DRAFT_189642 [Colletotrichum lupini]|nr:hypothetical protein BDP67DRAFT_189642 [Colletotrichum lupini]
MISLVSGCLKRMFPNVLARVVSSATCLVLLSITGFVSRVPRVLTILTMQFVCPRLGISGRLWGPFSRGSLLEKSRRTVCKPGERSRPEFRSKKLGSSEKRLLPLLEKDEPDR